MKFTAKRLFGAGIIGIAAIVTPLSLTAGLPLLTSSPSSVAFAGQATSCPQQATVDIICYNQSTGSSGTFAQYVPASTNGTGTATSVGLTSGGGCSTTTWQSTPVVDFAGKLYTDGTYSTLAAGNPFQVDASKQKTGVCGINGTGTNPWSIDNTSSGAEALVFIMGTNPNMGANRLFSEASLQVSNVTTATTHVELVETLTGSATPVGTQMCTLQGSQTLALDTNGGGACTELGTNPPGPNGSNPPGAFDKIQIEVPDANTQVSVVGPSSIFTLAKTICGNQAITAGGNGGAIATLSLPQGASCKTYTTFSSTSQGAGQPPLLSFNGFSNTPVQFTVTITWPKQARCQPYDDSNTNGAVDGSQPIPPGSAATGAGLTWPTCLPTEFSIDGQHFFDQTYCDTATSSSPFEPQAGMCTVSKSYANDTVTYSNSPVSCPSPQPACIATTTPLTLADGSPATQITEVWSGDVDMYWR